MAMASLLSPHRTDPAISLTTTVAAPPERPRPDSGPSGPVIGWLPLAIAGGWLSALASWVLVAGLAVVGWLAAAPGTLGQALGVGTDFWLLSNGVGARFGDVAWTLVPWGATAVLLVLVFQSAAFAARRVGDSVASALRVGTVLTGCYELLVLGVAALDGDPLAAVGHWLVVLAAIWLAAVLGAARALDQRLTETLPPWARAVPRAVAGAQLVMLLAGAALLASALIVHLDRVVALTKALDPGVAGGIALLVLQLAYAPNAIVWSGSYALGAGFTVGPGSAIAPAGTQLGILPGLPMLGALPANGAGRPEQLWWLVAGAIAGAVAAWIIVRGRPAARFDEASLVGGLSGLLAGLAFAGLAWAASGDLGSLRMTGLGPRLLPLLTMAVTTMGLSGMVVGLVLGTFGRGRLRGAGLQRR
jgi:hypothetical protein